VVVKPSCSRAAPVTHRSVPASGKICRLLTGLAILATYQVYTVSIAGTYLSVYLAFGWIATMTACFIMANTRFRVDAFAVTVLLLCAIQAVSISWSPDGRLGLREIVYVTPFISIYFLTLHVAKGNDLAIVQVMKAFALFAVPQSLLVVAFRFLPQAEVTFQVSQLARLFINPNTVAAVAEGSFGVSALSPDKAGGFFPNGNLAGAFAEIALYSGVIVAAATKRASRLLLFAIVLHYSAAILTGSKSAIALTLATPVIFWIVFQFHARRPLDRKVMAMVLGGAGAFAAYYVLAVAGDSSALVQDGQINATRRVVLWAFAADQFWQHPFLGHGFGGWYEAFFAHGTQLWHIGLNPDMPPHNALIVLWSQSGILAAVLGLAGMLIIARRALALRDRYGLFLAGACLSLIFSFFVHSMAENYTFYSEPHFQAPIAILFGWITHLYRNRNA